MELLLPMLGMLLVLVQLLDLKALEMLLCWMKDASCTDNALSMELEANVGTDARDSPGIALIISLTGECVEEKPSL